MSAVEEAYGKVDLAVVEVAVKKGADTDVYAVTEPRKRELPRTSKILPVVVVALAPRTSTLETVEG